MNLTWANPHESTSARTSDPDRTSSTTNRVCAGALQTWAYFASNCNLLTRHSYLIHNAPSHQFMHAKMI